MMRVLAIFMRLLGAVFKLFPLKRRVTLPVAVFMLMV